MTRKARQMERNDRRWMPRTESHAECPVPAAHEWVKAVDADSVRDRLEENLLAVLDRAESTRGRIVAWWCAWCVECSHRWRCAWCDRPLLSERCDCGGN
jgi:hypothetical protein